jgi:hypothetical protein
MATVSVVMSAYNVERYLAEAIDSMVRRIAPWPSPSSIARSVPIASGS